MNYKVKQLNKERFIFKIRSTSNLLSLIASALGGIIIFILVIIIIIFLIKKEEIDIGLAFIIPLFSYISISLINTFFWLKSGFELLEINLIENQITFFRNGLWKFDKYNFRIEQNLQIRYLEKNERIFDRVQTAYGYSGGGLLIENKNENKKVDFGLSLPDTELLQLKKVINSILSTTRKTNE